MESKSYSFRELLSECKTVIICTNLYFKLCAVGTLFRKERKLKTLKNDGKDEKKRRNAGIIEKEMKRNEGVRVIDIK